MTAVEECELPLGPDNVESIDDIPLDGVQFVNGIPCYTNEHKIRDAQIFERIGYDDRVGASYLALTDNKELVLRVATDKSAIVAMEKVFLDKVESRGLWPFFSQVHSAWSMDGLNYLTVYFRAGPTLRECLEFRSTRTFTLGTVARLGKDILYCLRHIHGMGYIARCLNIELFHLDAASRHLFMADISNIRLDPTSVGHAAAPWTGGSLFAPLRSHKKDYGLGRGDELEAFLYLIVLLHTGSLPWDSVYQDEVEECKRNSNVVDGLGEKWELIKKKIDEQSGVQIVKDSVYVEIGELLDEIAKEAGVKDEDDNYDFECEPNEEDLPKFIMEKRPIEPKEENE